MKQPRQSMSSARGWLYVLAVFALLLSLYALLLGPFALLILALPLLVIAITPDLWYRLGFKRLFIEWRINSTRAFVGDKLTLDVTLTNRKWLPLPWLELRSAVPIGLESYPITEAVKPSAYPGWYEYAEAFAFWRRQGIARQRQLFCAARGVYRLGATTLYGSDPMGLLTRSARLMPPLSSVLVYPLVAPLDDLSVDAIRPFGTLTTPRRVLDDPLRVVGVREYQPGDDPRRIHWKATARAGALHSKIYDPGAQHRFVLALDINAFFWSGSSYEALMSARPSLEYSITVLASLAGWALDNDHATGLLINAPILTPEEEAQAFAAQTAFPLARSPYMPTYTPADVRIGEVAQGAPMAPRTMFWLPPSDRPDQREQILDALARLRTQPGEAIERLIDAFRMLLGAGTTLLLVTAAGAIRPETIDYLSELQRHGIQTHLILVGPRQAPLATLTYNIPVHRIGGMEVWYELLAAARNGARDGSAPCLHLD